MCSDIFVVFERAELREFKTQTCRAHQFDSYSDLDYIRDVLMTWNMRNLIIHIHVYMRFISRFQLNSWTQFGLRSPDLRCHMFKHLCVRADHHQPSCFPFFLGLHVTLSWFLSEYCLIIRFHPNLDQGFFFFFSFVTPSCLYFVVVRNPSLMPAVYTIKLTFIYVALFFLTRLQGALERKKQTADEAAQIKRNK